MGTHTCTCATYPPGRLPTQALLAFKYVALFKVIVALKLIVTMYRSFLAQCLEQIFDM